MNKKKSSNRNAKPLSGIMWAWFTPDNVIQVRTIAKSRKLSNLCLMTDADLEEHKNIHKVIESYENQDWYCEKIVVDIFPQRTMGKKKEENFSKVLIAKVNRLQRKYCNHESISMRQNKFFCDFCGKKLN